MFEVSLKRLEAICSAAGFALENAAGVDLNPLQAQDLASGLPMDGTADSTLALKTSL